MHEKILAYVIATAFMRYHMHVHVLTCTVLFILSDTESGSLTQVEIAQVKMVENETEFTYVEGESDETTWPG